VISPSFVTFLNYRLADAVCDRTPPAAGSDAVVVVAIDEQSLDRFGQWPRPRYRLAQLVEKAGQLEAASIGLDFIMAEPDRLSLQTVLEAIRRDMGHEVEIPSAPGEIKDNDALLAAALSRWPSVLGFKFLFDAAAGDSACRLHPANTARASNARGKDYYGSFPQATGVVCNLAPFCEAVPASGFLNGIPDLDGVLRRVPLVIRYGEAIYPSLALATVMNASKTTAGSGEAAVEYLRSKPVDLLVLDMIMEPGIDGLETYRRIISIKPGQKTIVASGFSESERVKALQQLGAGAYIRKPYTMQSIGVAIRKELIRN
jgi:adenylate cyclase